jgi:hypothetical protein
VVGAKDVLLPGVELFFVDNSEWKADKDEQKLCPPPVKNSHELVPPREDNWYEKEKEKDKKEDEENDEAVNGV